MPIVRILLILPVLAALSDPGLCAPADEALVHNREGIAALAKGEYEKAISSFDLAVKTLPGEAVFIRNLAAARNEYGVDLLVKGKTKSALGQLREAVKLNPDSSLYRTNLGTVLYRLDRHTEAITELEKVVTREPGFVAARSSLGKVYYGRGELAKAILHWEVALRLEPGRSDVAEKLAKARREFETERDYDLLEGEHFAISWDGDADRSIGGRVMRILEDAYREVGRELGIFPQRSVRVILYGEKEFKKVTGAQDWVGGLFDGSIRLPVRNFVTAEREIRDKIFHEYTHVAVRSLTGKCPVWLNEGLAQVLEGKNLKHASSLVARAGRSGDLLGQPVLAAPYSRFEDAGKARLAYAEALLLTRFVLDQHGPEPVRRFLKAIGGGRESEGAAKESFGRTLDAIFTAWRQTL